MLAYYLVRGLIALFSITPFWLLYALSDLMSWLLRGPLPYRRRVILDNLRQAFPHLSETERISIQKAFYRNLCDILFETLKGLSMDRKTIEKRVRIVGEANMNAYAREGTEVVGLAAHIANWEWPAMIINRNVQHNTIGIYKPIKNKRIDTLIQRKRESLGSPVHSLKDFRSLLFATQNPDESPRCVLLIADQTPPSTKGVVWTPFMGLDTPWYPGAELYSRRRKTPLIYFDVHREKRGHYRLDIEVLHDAPHELPRGGVTRLYAERLRQRIEEKPEDWLWSHRRWKRARPLTNA